MASQESAGRCENSETDSLVEVIREGLRKSVISEQKRQREKEVNRRRTELGQNLAVEQHWNADQLILKAKELRKKTLAENDYITLVNTLIQDEGNIRIFMSVTGTIQALIRDLTSPRPEVQLSSAHCFCNLSLANKSLCSTLCKYAGPHLVMQLESFSNPILEVMAWTVGNLCSGSRNACKTLFAQGCHRRLLSLLHTCDLTILPSIMYAITHCILGGSDLLSDEESVKIINSLVHRKCIDSTESLWILALLSSKHACAEALSVLMPPIFDKFVTEIRKKSPNTKEMSAVIRLLGNLVPEASGSVAGIIFNNPKYSAADVLEIFKILLTYPHIHVRKEILWVLGNLYNHPQENIKCAVKDLLPGLTNSMQLAVQSVQL